jgi:hypothetical protein
VASPISTAAITLSIEGREETAPPPLAGAGQR